jgi:hypothetical protein
MIINKLKVKNQKLVVSYQLSVVVEAGLPEIFVGSQIRLMNPPVVQESGVAG